MRRAKHGRYFLKKCWSREAQPCFFEKNRQNYNVGSVNHVNVAENQQNQDVELESCEYKIYPDLQMQVNILEQHQVIKNLE